MPHSTNSTPPHPNHQETTTVQYKTYTAPLFLLGELPQISLTSLTFNSFLWSFLLE